LEVSPKIWRGSAVGRLLAATTSAAEASQAQIVDQQRVAGDPEGRERLARELHDDLGQVLAS